MNIKRFAVGELSTNCYLLTASGGDAALVDPGGVSETLLAELSKVNLKMVLLTHGHYDHIAGVEKLRELYPDLSVCIHEEDEVMLRAPECNFSREISGCPYVTSADRLLRDGDKISLGELTLTTAHTPGHSLGSVCYCVGEIIFSGDTIFHESAGRTDLYGGSEQSLFDSVRKIRDLEGDRILLPGHGKDTTLAHERQANYFMRRLR